MRVQRSTFTQHRIEDWTKQVYWATTAGTQGGKITTSPVLPKMFNPVSLIKLHQFKQANLNLLRNNCAVRKIRNPNSVKIIIAYLTPKYLLVIKAPYLNCMSRHSCHVLLWPHHRHNRSCHSFDHPLYLMDIKYAQSINSETEYNPKRTIINLCTQVTQNVFLVEK